MGIILPLLFLGGCGSKDLQTATEQGATQVMAQEARNILSGSKVTLKGYDDDATATFHPNGKISAKNSQDLRNDGIWKIDDQDRLCLKFKRWGHGDKLCYTIYRRGDEYLLFNKSIKLYDLTIINQNFEQPKARKTSSSTSNRQQAAPARTDSPAAANTPGTPTYSPVVVTPQDKEDISSTIREIAKNCQGCNLRKAYLRDADLSNAELAGANLAEADLRNANLRRANLQGANLFRANLTGADLRGANITGANLQETIGLDR